MASEAADSAVVAASAAAASSASAPAADTASVLPSSLICLVQSFLPRLDFLSSLFVSRYWHSSSHHFAWSSLVYHVHVDSSLIEDDLIDRLCQRLIASEKSSATTILIDAFDQRIWNDA